jgi:hypothetical protein
VYFSPSPPWRGEGAGRRFFDSDLQRALARTGADGEHHAVGRTRAGHALTLVEHHRQFARLGIQTPHRVLADADAGWQERAKAAVHAGQEFDPLLRRLGAAPPLPISSSDRTAMRSPNVTAVPRFRPGDNIHLAACRKRRRPYVQGCPIPATVRLA